MATAATSKTKTPKTATTPAKVTTKKPTRRKTAVVHSAVNLQEKLMDRLSLDIRKPIAAILVRNRSQNQITLTERKAMNNILGYAQMINRKHPEIDTETYRLPVKRFEELMGFSANNRWHLLQTLRNIQDIKVEFNFAKPSNEKRSNAQHQHSDDSQMDGPEQIWGIANFIGEIYFDSKSKDVIFSLPPKAKQMLLRPEHFNRIQSMLLNQFTSHASMVLYEVLSSYFSAPVKRTRALHWTEWSVALSGASEPHSAFREFNKMLVRALDQVNAVIQDEGLKAVVHRSLTQKRVEQVWFEIESLTQSSLALESRPMSVSGEALKMLGELGLGEDIISDLVLRFGEEYVLAQYDYLRRRLAKKDKDKVTNPKAFFLASVENNYASAPRMSLDDIKRTSEEKEVEQESNEQSGTQLMAAIRSEWLKAKTNEIRAQFDAQDDEKKQEIVAEIVDDLKKCGAAIWKAYNSKGIASPIVKAAIINIIIQKKVEDPSAEELLIFAMKNGLITPSLNKR